MEESEKWFGLSGTVQEYKQWEKKIKIKVVKMEREKEWRV